MEIKQLAPEIILGDPRAADVVAEHDGNVVGKRGLRAVDDALKDDRAVVLLDLSRIREGAVKQGIWKSRRDSGAEECPAFLEKSDHVIVHFSAVFDGINSVFQSNADTFGRFDVCGNHVSVCMSLVADCAHHVRRHLQFSRDSLFLCIKHSTGDHELDYVNLFFLTFVQVGKGFIYVCSSDSYRSRHMSPGN